MYFLERLSRRGGEQQSDPEQLARAERERTGHYPESKQESPVRVLQEMVRRLGEMSQPQGKWRTVDFDDGCYGNAVRAYQEQMAVLANAVPELEKAGWQVVVEANTGRESNRRTTTHGKVRVDLKLGGMRISLCSQEFGEWSYRHRGAPRGPVRPGDELKNQYDPSWDKESTLGLKAKIEMAKSMAVAYRAEQARANRKSQIEGLKTRGF